MLIEALPYLQKFRGRTMVVKLGGAAIGPDGNLADALFSVVFLSQVGVGGIPEFFSEIYTYAWFVGFIISLLVYVLLMKGRPPTTGAGSVPEPR